MSNINYGEQAEERLIISLPLFTRMILETPFVSDETVKTLETDGTEVRYNPNFLDGRTPNDVMFMFAHELAHIFVAHQYRYNPTVFTNDKDWQLACDYEVNGLLKDSGFNIPRDAYYNYVFDDMSAEEIYAAINQDNEESPFNEENHGRVNESPETKEEDEGEGTPDPNACQQKRQELIEKQNGKMREAVQTCMMAGNLTDNMERRFKKYFKTVRNWKDILADTLTRCTGKDDFTYTRVNRRFSCSEFIYPGMYSENSDAIAVVVDTSGSISEELLAKMIGDIVSLVEDVSPEKLIVMSCDSKVKSYYTFENGEPVEDIRLRGGGGTDFRPPFAKLEEMGEEVNTMIYLTDGYCNSFPPEPEFPVIWVIWQDRTRVDVPFGEVIVMEKEK